MEQIPVRHIHSHPEAVNASTFNIRRIESLFGGRDIVQPLHRHNFYFILFLDKGNGAHDIDFNTYSIIDRSIFIMKPGQAHKLSLMMGSDGYLIEFNADFYNRVLDHNLNRIIKANYIQFEPSIYGRVKVTFDHLFDEHLHKRQNYQAAIKAILDIFFIEVSRAGQTGVDTKERYAFERLDAFTELIENNMVNHKEVSFYANELNLSLYQLNAITKTVLQKSASDVIVDHIMLEAKRYLLATSNQINQIAGHLGYDDVSYFVRFFKKHTGYTPEGFRQNSI